jgi:hypothetical protein
MQRRIDAGSASTSRVERLRATIAELEAKHGPAPKTAPPPKQYPKGKLVREAEQVAEAIRRAKRGDIGEASATTGAPHKLPPHVTYG